MEETRETGEIGAGKGGRGRGYMCADKAAGAEWRQLMKKVIELEWQMFTNVRNEGGRAACQDDRSTFEIMRTSQFSIWSEEALESWKRDLEDAGKSQRNLMAEKYAYMMADIVPKEYECISHLLPKVSVEKHSLAEKLTQMQVCWREAAEVQYPFLKQQGRALRKGESGSGEASLETYVLGELLTYSLETLELLKNRFEELEMQGVNPGICILEDMVQHYGYQNLAAAQKAWDHQQIE